MLGGRTAWVAAAAAVAFVVAAFDAALGLVGCPVVDTGARLGSIGSLNPVDLAFLGSIRQGLEDHLCRSHQIQEVRVYRCGVIRLRELHSIAVHQIASLHHH